MEEPTSEPGAQESTGAPDGPGRPDVLDGTSEAGEVGMTAVAEVADEPAVTAGPAASASEGPVQPAGPRPIGVPVTPTGHGAVDEQLRRLADADHLAASGHLQVYEDVHRGLRDALAALDQRPGPPAPPGTPGNTPGPGAFATYDNRS